MGDWLRGVWICKLEAKSFSKPPYNKCFHSNRGPNLGTPTFEDPIPTFKQSRARALYQLAITRQSLDGVVVENPKSFEAPGTKRLNISMLVVYVCTGKATSKSYKTNPRWPFALPLGHLTHNKFFGPEIGLAETHGHPHRMLGVVAFKWYEF